MKLSWIWLTSSLLRLLSLSQVGLASTVSRALSTGASVRLVTGITVGLEFEPSSLSQPPHLSLDETTYVQLARHELALPIMPLHLLGKKSWNVYNQDNIARVKRDEAIARAKEEAEEERMQKIDAERRLQILRGERPGPPPVVEEADVDDRQQEGYSQRPERERKRKRFGEDDTEFELRIAHQRTKASASSENQIVRKQINNAPLTDRAGHINLFPQDDPKFREKNAEAEEEAARKKKEFEDQYTMRFSNAAGFKQGLENPWYSMPTASSAADEISTLSKDVWGNEDPRRKDREAARIVSSDPLAAMRQGAARVREVERERRRWREKREKEVFELQREESRKRKRSREDDGDDLEDFSLDIPEKSARQERNESGRKHRDGRRSHRRRSQDRESTRRHRSHRH